MKVTKHIYSFLILTGFVLLFAASSSQREAAEPPPDKISPSFNYTPPTEGVSRAENISFVLLNPIFASGFDNHENKNLISSSIEPWKNFSRNMSRDFEEMLTSRGYRFRGPFNSYDELVYSDKRDSDLLLEVIIDFTFTGVNDAIKADSYVRDGRRMWRNFHYDGDITIGGKIDLILSEPHTQERIRVQSIPIPTSSFTLKSYHKYNANQIPVGDPLIWNAVVENLERIYKNVLQRAFDHLDPEDVTVLQNQSVEIKESSGYSR